MDILNNKRALITGGASGIGRATVELFAKEGAAVVIADINTELGKQVEREIQQAGGKAVFVPCDVTRVENCQHAVQVAVEQFGRLDILFNNAASKFRICTGPFITYNTSSDSSPFTRPNLISLGNFLSFRFGF